MTEYSLFVKRELKVMGRKSGLTKPKMRPIVDGAKLSGAQRRHLAKEGYPLDEGPRGAKHTGGRGKQARSS
jgi:hypothetical protein